MNGGIVMEQEIKTTSEIYNISRQLSMENKKYVIAVANALLFPRVIRKREIAEYQRIVPCGRSEEMKLLIPLALLLIIIVAKRCFVSKGNYLLRWGRENR